MAGSDGEDSIRRVRVLHSNVVPSTWRASSPRTSSWNGRSSWTSQRMPTFTARGAAVKWRVVVRVELEGWPAWTHEIRVVVRPPAAPVAPRPGT
jgi:hypothetical protein